MRLLVTAIAFTLVHTQAAEFKLGIHTFTLPDGYTIESVAAAPLVDRPINMAVDESGALYVTDSSGSNEAPAKQVQNPTHRVVRLVDSDGDGTFDKQTVFADKLSFPEGAMWLDGSLYVAAPPVIWKLTDTNGDGIADKREVWYDGKTLTGCANDLHGPYAGPDGYIYWCKGAFAEQRHTLADGKQLVSRASHIFRAKPDGSGREMVMTGGMDNPVDLVFSPAGERFLSNTFLVNPGGGQRDGIIHAVNGGVWGKQHSVIEGHPRTGDLMPIMTHLGPAAASGLEMLRGNALGMRGDLLCTQFNMRKVSRHVLTPEGSTFATKDSDFVLSDQTDFHPTDVLECADGSVLIADTGGWYKLCCPTSQLVKPDVLGAIYRVRKQGAKPDGKPKVGDFMDDPAAVWTLTRSPGEEARAKARTALRAAKPDVIIAAAYSAGLWRDRQAVPDLLGLLAHSDAHIRRAAIEALGRIGDRTTAQPLAKVDVGNDRFLQHAVAYALFEIGDSAGLAALDGGSAKAAAKMLATQSTMKLVAAVDIPEPRALPAPDAAVVVQQRKRLEELAVHLKDGDAKRGGDVFRSAKATCVTCHAVASVGGTFAPDLTKVGAIRTERDILEAIIFPSASFVRSYEPVRVKTKTGEALGVMKKNAADEIILSPAPNIETKIPRAEVVDVEFSPVSLMPQGIDGILTPQELADLVVYLRSLK